MKLADVPTLPELGDIDTSGASTGADDTNGSTADEVA